VGLAAKHRGDVLDVGCGDGFSRATPRSGIAVGDGHRTRPATADRALGRIGDLDNVQISHASFQEFDPGTQRFDLITFVASLHHMDLGTTLAEPATCDAIRRDSRRRTVRQRVGVGLGVVSVLPARRQGGRRLHGDTPDIGVTLADPRESLRTIRRMTAEVLPGAVIRRKLYYRYLLRWSSGPSGR